MTKEEKIEALEKMGGNRWQKGNFDRIYFNANVLGLECKYYKTGSISDSEFRGEIISHSRAYAMKSTKCYVDLNKDFEVVCSDSMMAEALEEIMEKIEEEAKEAEAAEEEAKEAESEAEAKERMVIKYNDDYYITMSKDFEIKYFLKQKLVRREYLTKAIIDGLKKIKNEKSETVLKALIDTASQFDANFLEKSTEAEKQKQQRSKKKEHKK